MAFPVYTLNEHISVRFRLETHDSPVRGYRTFRLIFFGIRSVLTDKLSKKKPLFSGYFNLLLKRLTRYGLVRSYTSAVPEGSRYGHQPAGYSQE